MMRNYRILYSESVMRLDVGKDHTIKMVMVEPVASLTLKNIVAGRTYVFLFQQSDSNPTTIFYCPQMLNKVSISPRRGSLTVQAFVGLNAGAMAASMAASYYRTS